MRPYELTLTEAARAVAAKDLSPVELTDSVLERIEAVDGGLGAYATVLADDARQAAARAGREIAEGGPRGPLHGVPMALKDMIDVAGVPTGAGSRARAGRPAADRDAAVWARLREAGAVLLGKAHTHEFAFGLTTPQTRNAWNDERVAGGSSGGSAVAVASGTATYALGTDTGGSVRVPAALNGVVGLKPTYGLLPTDGVVPLSWSLDHVGTLTRTVEDAALVIDGLLGRPAAAAADRRAAGDLTGLRVGVPRDHYFDRVAPEVAEAVHAAIGRLRELGAELVDVAIPMGEYVMATQWGLMVPEAAAYHEHTVRASPELYGPDVRVLLEAGTLLPAVDHLRAHRSRTLMREAWDRLFDEVDLVAAPTVPVTAVHRDRPTVTWPDGVEESVSDSYVRLCAPADITGVPALSVPAGTDGAGLPIGLQLMGRRFDESTVLAAGRAYEASRAGETPGPSRPGLAPAPERAGESRGNEAAAYATISR